MNFKSYLQTHARKLDLRLYEHLFEKAGAQPVIDELSKYQNADGGFGNGLEPDLQLPDSSALATTVAFQYLAKLQTNTSSLAEKAIHYLADSYDNPKQRWVNIPPTANKHPRAPWWNYEEVLQWAGWGNPSAEILGYLLQYADKLNDKAFLKKVSEQAIQHLYATTKPEQHEVKCYIRLYNYAGKDLQAKLYDRLAAHIKQLAKTDLKDWVGYTATPLTFIDSPDSPFANLFSKQLLLKNAHYISQQIVANTHWEPTWQWGQFDKEWAKAKQDWSGKLTVENIELLKAFGIRVEPKSR